MDDRWKDAEPLLEQALELDPDAQAAFLEVHCPDPELRAYVAALLRADAAAPAFLDQDAAVLLGQSSPASGPDGLAGRRVGAYRLLRELGRGGMGVVYLAEHEDLGRQVALKLVRGHWADPLASSRFLREQQLLARLEHPHIARLYDAGIAQDGAPFFAMEYVEGAPLVRYCDAHQLDVSARLRLFVLVGEAVQHAHQHFIVHRDLKPSNIMVADTPTGSPQVKLLDFGIAKVIADTDEAGEEQETHTRDRRMTLAYAAPEQIRGETVSAATDVYSLGVVLYEVLTGKRPFAMDSHEIDAIQEVLTKQPKRPSTTVTEHHQAVVLAEARGVSTEQLQRSLRGDLDLICLKALAKEPEQRYPSAAAFVEDIQRHLAGLPVTARPASMGYRFRKFVTRHQQGVGIAAVMVVVLVSLVAYYTGRLQEERDLAQREAQTTAQVADFMAGLFTVSNPWVEVGGDTLRAIDLLERGAARLRTELADEPVVQARMMQTIGVVFEQLGRYDQAWALLDEGRALQQTALDIPNADAARTLRALGRVAVNQGRYDEGDSLGRQAQRIDAAVFHPRHLTIAEDLYVQVVAQRGKAAFGQADSLLQEELAIRIENNDTEAHLARTWHIMADIKAQQGDYAAAESLEVKALEVYRRQHGANHPAVAEALNNLATFSRLLGKLEVAEAHHREALQIKRASLPAEHPSLATTLGNLGILLGIQGRYEESGQFLREALRIRQALYSEDHPLVAGAMRSLAMLALNQEDYTEAERYAIQVIDVMQAAYGPQHPSTGGAYELLGTIRLSQREFAAAEEAHRAALAIYRASLDTGHDRIGIELNNLGVALLGQGNYVEAEEVLLESLAIRRAALGEDHPGVANPLRNLGRLYGEMGRFEEGEPLLLEALRMQESLREQHPARERTLAAMVAFYEVWGKPDTAAKYDQAGNP